MGEIWKDIRDYEGLYQVSDLGRVRSLLKSKSSGGILRQNLNTGKYLCVGLYKNGQRIGSHRVHRLVIETFVSPCPNECECRHLDGNRHNNSLHNLQWGTHKENSQDSIMHETFHVPNNIGSNNGRAILEESSVCAIRKLLQSGRNGQPGRRYSQTEIARMFGVNRYTISMIATRKTWKHLP